MAWPNNRGVPYEPSYDGRRDIRDEYEMLVRKFQELEKQCEYFRDIAIKNEEMSKFARGELKSQQNYMKILELALHIAVQDDKKKAEVLEHAKKSIEVLKTFEK